MTDYQRHNTTLDTHTVSTLRAYGGGNLSQGIRRAAEVVSASQTTTGSEGVTRPKSTTFRGHATPEWATHDSRKPPTDLAPAQFVFLECEMPAGLYRVDEVNWEPGLRYRLALSEDGLPLCSAEGLAGNTLYVATDACGCCVREFESKPYPGETLMWRRSDPNQMWSFAPDTHRRLVPWHESLMEVHCD